MKYYFTLWKKYVEQKKVFREYDQWCEIHNEELKEQQFASENAMDPIYWCWNCK